MFQSCSNFSGEVQQLPTNNQPCIAISSTSLKPNDLFGEVSGIHTLESSNTGSNPAPNAFLGFCPLDNQQEKRTLLLVARRKVVMGDKSSDLVQGTLDMLVLKTLALEPMHGYGICVRIEQMSKGVFRLNAGSLFLAIQRLERDGLIDGEWKPTENNRRARYYTLTQKGRKRLDSETREWGRQAAAIARILEAQ
jgi:PadR family transcriptional regulator, regulatory protein PadR